MHCSFLSLEASSSEWVHSLPGKLPFWWPSVGRLGESEMGITHTIHESGFVNSLWPGDVIWWHRSGSILAQVMTCCLTVPSHYLNQCWLTWLIISGSCGIHHATILQEAQISMLKIALLKLQQHLLRHSGLIYWASTKWLTSCRWLFWMHF